MNDSTFSNEADETKDIACTSQFGTAYMRGKESGDETLMKKKIPIYAHYVHCYAHQAYIVLKQVLSCVKEARIFFSKLFMIIYVLLYVP